MQLVRRGGSCAGCFICELDSCGFKLWCMASCWVGVEAGIVALCWILEVCLICGDFLVECSKFLSRAPSTSAIEDIWNSSFLEHDVSLHKRSFPLEWVLLPRFERAIASENSFSWSGSADDVSNVVLVVDLESPNMLIMLTTEPGLVGRVWILIGLKSGSISWKKQIKENWSSHNTMERKS